MAKYQFVNVQSKTLMEFAKNNFQEKENNQKVLRQFTELTKGCNSFKFYQWHDLSNNKDTPLRWEWFRTRITLESP